MTEDDWNLKLGFHYIILPLFVLKALEFVLLETFVTAYWARSTGKPHAVHRCAVHPSLSCGYHFCAVGLYLLFPVGAGVGLLLKILLKLVQIHLAARREGVMDFRLLPLIHFMDFHQWLFNAKCTSSIWSSGQNPWHHSLQDAKGTFALLSFWSHISFPVNQVY